MEFYIERFKDIESKTYELEIITPMFLSGADTKKAELRIPPIKGMLRFWWRATCNIADISKMRGKENKIFGSTGEKSSFSVYLNITNNNTPLLKFDEYKKKALNFKVHEYPPVSILDYLSYGTYEYKKGDGNKYLKEHIKPGSKFSIVFRFFNPNYKEEIINVFKYLLSFSGLGAKSRNGFGSIYCKDFDNIQDLNNLNLGKVELKDFTAFSKESKIFKIPIEYDSWEEAISKVGLIYRESRTSIEKHHTYDKRKLISAPLQVNKKNLASEERHSKPYFLKIQKLKNEKFKGMIIYIPYKYHDEKNLMNYKSACDLINKKIEEKLNDMANSQ